ncbi:MarC family protein [archaeon]|jgi:multiple antibiotic resistance protein|nr:MarC family protein [archaeon]
MIDLIIAFFVMINPFALFLYLEPIRKDIGFRKYLYVLFKATSISLVVYFLFVLFGNFLFDKVFQIHFESFRIFGGIIIFAFAYLFIVGGKKAMIQLRGSLDDLASDIALPFIVGAGTISITLLMVYGHGRPMAFLGVIIALLANFLFIVSLGLFRKKLTQEKFKVAFDKNMGVLLRIMGFFSGAIGVNMVITGIQNLISA